MKFLHWEVDAVEGTVVRVDLDAQANVMLLDDSNFSSYRHGHRFNYRGGLAERRRSRWCRRTPAAGTSSLTSAATATASTPASQRRLISGWGRRGQVDERPAVTDNSRRPFLHHRGFVVPSAALHPLAE
jgi:hypothetical protein